AEMDLARLLGEFVADIIGVLAHLPGHLAKLAHEAALLVAKCERQFLLAARGRHGRCHQRFFHLRRIAGRARHQAALLLGVEIGAVAEPAVEFVAVRATKGEADHPALRSGRGGAGTVRTPNSRAFCRFGTLARAETDAFTSMS